MERLGCSISRKKVWRLLQDCARSIIIHLISSECRLHILYRLSINDIGWNLTTMLYRSNDSHILPMLLQQTSGISCSHRGLTSLSMSVLVSYAGKQRIVLPVKICFQGVELHTSLVEAGSHDLCQIPGTIPFGSHVLHQQPKYVFRHPIVIYSTTTSSRG